MIKQHTLEQHTSALANYFPGGKLWASKYIVNTNLRKLLKGISWELFNAEGYLKEFQDQYLPDETVLFIDEWEQAVGIPDSCFSGVGSISDRRLSVLVKLASLGVQTAQDFVALAAIFGVTITVTPGASSPTTVFPYTFPFQFFSAVETRFLIIVDFVTVPNTVLECLFTKLKPANVDIIFTS